MKAQKNSNKKKEEKKVVPDSSLDFSRLPYIMGEVKRKKAKAWVLFDGEFAGVYPDRNKLNKQLARNPNFRCKQFSNILDAIEAFKNPDEHLNPPAKAKPLF